MNPFSIPLIRRAAWTLVATIVVVLVGYLGVWQWLICRIEVPPGTSLLVRYKGPWPFGSTPQAPEGTLVKTDAHGQPLQVGILEAMPGPGRHFYSPLEYETQLVKDQIIPPGKIGVLVSKMGKPLPEGAYLVDEPGYRGIVRKVLTPGRYRINSYAFEVRVADADACVEPATRVSHKGDDATLIPPGYVGVVTNKASDPLTREERGIRKQVLQPGIYFLNPEEKRIDIVSIGYSETSLLVETRDTVTSRRTESGRRSGPASPASPPRAADRGERRTDDRGDRLGETIAADPEFVPGKGIEFPSSDGFPIHLDYTAIWGILPEQAPQVVRQFGTLKDVEQKVILPQIESICRLHGSRRGAVDLLVGDTREQFQLTTSAELERVLKTKELSLLFGLTRHIYVPKAVREPIQRAKIADELTKTRDQEQLTAKAQADLTEAKARVVYEEKRTQAETGKMAAGVAAEGEKKAKEVEAMTEKLTAEIEAKTAAIEARTTRLLGEAKARSVKLSKEAKAERFQLLVKAMGGPESYGRYVFAQGLPDDLRLAIFHAGPGTFWTDLKGFEQTMLGKMASESAAKAPAGPARTVTQTAEDRRDPGTDR